MNGTMQNELAWATIAE